MRASGLQCKCLGDTEEEEFDRCVRPGHHGGDRLGRDLGQNPPEDMEHLALDPRGAHREQFQEDAKELGAGQELLPGLGAA